MCKKKHQRQIAMGWLRREPEPKYFPEGYTVVNYDGDPRQRAEFFRLWNDRYGTDAEVEQAFNSAFVNYRDCQPLRDVFFVKYGDEYVGTITAIHHPKGNQGYVHMVAIRDDYRGRHLSGALNYIAMRKIYDDGSSVAMLTTNEWRQNAIRSYIKAGFLPLMNGVGRAEKRQMVQRWRKVYRDLGLGEMQMLDKKYRLMSKEELKKLAGDDIDE